MPKMQKLAANPFNSCQRLYPSMNISPGSQLKTTIGRAQKGAQCPLLAQSGHRTHAGECPLLGVKQTLPGAPAIEPGLNVPASSATAVRRKQRPRVCLSDRL